MLRSLVTLVRSNIIVSLLGLLQGFVVARFLGPAQYGLLKLLDMIPQLAKYGDLGFISVVRREIPFYQGAQDHEKAQLIRNISYSSEIILSIIISAICFGIAVYYVPNTVIVVGILSYTLVLLLQKLLKIYKTESVIQRKFKILSRVILFSGGMSAIGIISLVPFIGIYAMFTIIPISIFLTLVFARRHIPITFKFMLAHSELTRIIKVGIPLSLATINTGIFQYSKRLTVNHFLGIVYLGYYGIALQLLTLINSNASFITRMTQPQIAEYIGEKKFKEAINLVKYTMGFSLFTLAIIVGFALINISWAIELILPQFSLGIASYYGLLLCGYITFSQSLMRVLLGAPSVDKLYQLLLVGFSSTITFLGIVYYLDRTNNLTFPNMILAEIAAFSIRWPFLYVLFIRHFKIKAKEVLELTIVILLPLIPVGIMFFITQGKEIHTTNILIMNSVMLLIAGLYYPAIRHYYLKIKKII